MADTEHFGIPKPRETDNIDAEMRRLQAAWDTVDEILNTFLQAINGKAPTNHSHAMDQVSGLATALAAKMPTNRTFTLAELTDVVGYTDAPQGYVPVKNADGKVIFLSASAAIGNHQHTMSDIVDLDTALDARIKWISSGEALPTENIGPVWHDAYKSVMTWQTFTANGAAYAGYASEMVGRPDTDSQPTARSGYVKRNGASLSKTSYAALWNWALHNGLVVALGSWTAGPFVFADNGNGTFKLPDNRGEFERNWDDGRGVDSGRALGSWQDSVNKTHVHTGTTDAAGAHAHGIPSRVSDPNHRHFNNPGTVSEGAEGGGVGGDATTYSAGNHTHPFTTAASGSAEARPRSVALNAIIKF